MPLPDVVDPERMDGWMITGEVPIKDGASLNFAAFMYLANETPLNLPETQTQSPRVMIASNLQTY